MNRTDIQTCRWVPWKNTVFIGLEYIFTPAGRIGILQWPQSFKELFAFLSGAKIAIAYSSVWGYSVLSVLCFPLAYFPSNFHLWYFTLGGLCLHSYWLLESFVPHSVNCTYGNVPSFYTYVLWSGEIIPNIPAFFMLGILTVPFKKQTENQVERPLVAWPRSFWCKFPTAECVCYWCINTY